MSDGTCKTRPDIEYPCPWAYRIIGADEAALRTLVAELMADRAHSLTVSNRSARGRYISLRLELTVDSEADRQGLFDTLSENTAVKIVL